MRLTSTTTIIAGGSAVGYYIFQGKRWNGELLEGALAGSDGEMSKSGWSVCCFQDNSLKYLSMFSFDAYLALQVESFWGLTSLRFGHLDMKP
jgi:hypothetical protein